MVCYCRGVSESYFLYWFWEVTIIEPIELERETWITYCFLTNTLSQLSIYHFNFGIKIWKEFWKHCFVLTIQHQHSSYNVSFPYSTHTSHICQIQGFTKKKKKSKSWWTVKIKNISAYTRRKACWYEVKSMIILDHPKVSVAWKSLWWSFSPFILFTARERINHSAQIGYWPTRQWFNWPSRDFILFLPGLWI